MEIIEKKAQITAISQLLEQIELCNYQIQKYIKRGENEDNLPIRQEKHLRNQYLKQLDDLLDELDIHLKL